MEYQSPSGKGLSDPFLSFPIIQEGTLQLLVGEIHIFLLLGRVR